MSAAVPVAPGTVVVWSDLACPWASLAVQRLHVTRSDLGLDEDVRLDHRAFPLELINARPTPKDVLDAETTEITRSVPGLDWAPWSRPDSEWPGTVLVALEAVQAAKSDAVGGLRASEALDLALRRAFYVESRPIGLLPEVLAVARTCPDLDVDTLERALTRGAGRAEVIAQWHEAGEVGVQGSPHLFLPDGTDAHNPGVRLGQDDAGRPHIEADDPGVYDDLLRRALGVEG